MKKIVFTLIILIHFNTINAANESTVLEALGFLSATNALITTNGLGATWDSWVTDGYNDEEFEEYTLFYQNIIISTKEQLNSLYRYGELSYEDKEYIGDLIEIYDALHEQSRTALKYSYTKKDSDHSAYHNSRLETINKMNTLFELDWK